MLDTTDILNYQLQIFETPFSYDTLCISKLISHSALNLEKVYKLVYAER